MYWTLAAPYRGDICPSPEADNIRKTIATYRANFRRLVEGQVQVLKETDSLFD